MFYFSYQHDSSRVKDVDCMNDLFCAAKQVKNINYISSPSSPAKQMKTMLVITSNGKIVFVPNPSKVWTVPELPWSHSSRL